VAKVPVEDRVRMAAGVVRRVARENEAEDERRRPVACRPSVVYWLWAGPSDERLRTNYHGVHFLHHIRCS